MWILNKALRLMPLHTDLGPVWALPLRAAAFALAGFPCDGLLQLHSLTQLIINRAVKSWCHHLPAAHRAELKPLSTCPGTFAPATSFPPASEYTIQQLKICHQQNLRLPNIYAYEFTYSKANYIKTQVFSIKPGQALFPCTELMCGLRPGQSVAVTLIHLWPVILHT